MASKTDLVIVESPSKAKTIGKYLGPGYEVKASMGHVRDLPKSKMSVDIEGGFIPNYQPIKGKEDVISDLKKAAKKSDRVYLATDPDREGEAISWHLKELLGIPDDKTYRVTFNEITKKVVNESIASRVQGEKKVYLVLNKPKGYVTSLDDPHAAKTVMDLVRGACTERIYPVGRLDKNSLGLLLFTNDGDMTKQLTHPSYRKKKIYQVSLDKPLTRADMDRIAEGVTLEDGEIHADEISYVKENKQEVGIEIHSGRNRIVRRIFESLGYTVSKLDRVYYAGLTKKNLKRGAWRFLTREEVERLKSGQYE